jgi:hypothetical protein
MVDRTGVQIVAKKPDTLNDCCFTSDGTAKAGTIRVMHKVLELLTLSSTEVGRFMLPL